MSLLYVESLDHEGRGIARREGKTIFIEGALPGEWVTCTPRREKARYEIAEVEQIVHASPSRVTPVCPHFGQCGGCALQHLEVGAQLAVKQRVLEDALWHIARLRAQTIYPPIAGATWGYRQRARFSARFVASKGGVLVGFHERRRSFIADMRTCPILPEGVSRLLPALRTLLSALSCAQRVPQVEFAQGETRAGAPQIALVLRHLLPLGAADKALLRSFADTHNIIWYTQAKGPETAELFYPETASAQAYQLPEFDLRLTFSPTEFTQVNAGVNRMLVRRAMQLLEVARGERVADLFCGLGNFSLPMARLGAQVVGVEGSPALVARAQANATANGLAANCRFIAADLFDTQAAHLAALAPLDKLLLDPPRDGAMTVVKALDAHAPRRIVYVSCNPATLARDAAVLTYEKGYILRGAGIAAMFPHTAHVESIALFEKIAPDQR